MMTLNEGHRKKLWSLKPEICRLFIESDLTIQQIADYLGGTYRHTFNTISKNFSSKQRRERKRNNYSKSRIGSNNPSFGKKGKDSFRWINGEWVEKAGYKMVTKPDWYTARKGSKYIFEHHEVYCLYNKITQIPKGHCIHHKDLDKSNNKIENLVLMSLGDHSKLHNRLRKGAETIENTEKRK